MSRYFLVIIWIEQIAFLMYIIIILYFRQQVIIYLTVTSICQRKSNTTNYFLEDNKILFKFVHVIYIDNFGENLLF